MMENFDKWWGLASVIGGLLATIMVTVVTATSDSDPATPETRWQQILRAIAAVITKVFSLSSFANEGTKRGFEFIRPFQSATPTTDAKKRLEGPK